VRANVPDEAGLIEAGLLKPAHRMPADRKLAAQRLRPEDCAMRRAIARPAL